jgi:catechol 2,3-dioxygenase-like lactoylglutathione lyase family enzyme
MSIGLDHIILAVNDRDASIDFYIRFLGLTREPDRPRFSMLRAAPGLVMQIAPWSTTGGEHLAFAMSKREFDVAFKRIKESGMPYGDRFDQVGNMRGPGEEEASKGRGKAVYFFDPNKHLLEIRHCSPT